MPHPSRPRPRALLEGVQTVFLDAGNTLVSIDWEQVSRELEALGAAVAPALLARAEAAARPALSRWIAGRSTEAVGTFEVYLRLILERLPAPGPGPAEPAALARALTPRLKCPGHADRLWNVPLPGVRQALETLRARGLARVVVSNSDGSVERSLVRAGLRDLIDQVVDSHLVGCEKPGAAIFERALALSGAIRERTVHVGDMYEADVRGARGAGIAAVLLDPYGDWAAEGPLDCPSAPDLPALVE